MNFAFIVVVLAAVSGLTSELALRSIAPEAGPALALAIMAIASLVTAWKSGKVKIERDKIKIKERRSPASESLAPT